VRLSALVRPLAIRSRHALIILLSALIAVPLAGCSADSMALESTSPSLEAESTLSIAPAASAPPTEPTSESPRSSDEPQRAYVLGDSLTYKARKHLAPALNAQGWESNPATDSRIGRMVAEGLSILAEQTDLPGTVLIALGTNDWLSSAAQSASWIAAARKIIGPQRTLIWVNLDMVGEKYSNYVTINQGLLEGAARDNRQLKRQSASGRTFIADWAAFAADRRIPHSKDGVHYKDGANRQRMEFYAGALALDPEYLEYLRSSATATAAD
jgi:hypothetical protein